MTDSSFEKKYLNKKVLLTGGSGFIGGRLKKRLLQIGAVVYSLDNRPAAAQTPNEIQCDIRNAEALNAAVSGISPEIVFHLAARVDRAQDPALIKPMLEVNLFGAVNLFGSLRTVPSCRSIVVSGTAEEYGRALPPFLESYREDPVGPYSFSKICVSYLASMFFKVYHLPVIVLRPTLAYGPVQEPGMFIPALITALMRGEKFSMTHGEQTRDFIYVDDLVDAYLKAGIAESGFGEVFNIGSGTPYKIKDVACKIAALLKKEPLLDVGGKNYRTAEIMEYYADISRARKILGWTPVTGLEEGLKLTLKGYMDRRC
ncbi:MAG: hypothetical protein A2270_04520 [Elusimicrobia bacterium RIFOXYA12_FULL_51_18]|nr:MAG: hypothetical protein A2270_04520 [Elusimicrobia bacterium RIFOXYA12_FULL_51_18]OGS32841.1 MAG: hypothetical protein A2218_10575 [Elusimicrobia bacterium RIFOXYA2_FULL_53_38]